MWWAEAIDLMRDSAQVSHVSARRRSREGGAYTESKYLPSRYAMRCVDGDATLAGHGWAWSPQ